MGGGRNRARDRYDRRARCFSQAAEEIASFESTIFADGEEFVKVVLGGG
jgi:hypothetical protein